MDKKILDLLYRSFDSDLDEEKKKQLEEALKESEELRQEKEQLLTKRNAIADSAETSFKPFFAERIIEQINAFREKENTLETFYTAFKAMYWRFAAVGAIALIALIAYNIGVGENLPMKEAFFISDITFEEILQLPLF